VRYVELNPFEARIESASGTYMRTSVKERLELIKKIFLRSVKQYFICA
jgi:hypothetical protein|tara:strand:- start:1966 stop:2109 length:144 start_codon:yes stop_codon:yes gene_type:complete